MIFNRYIERVGDAAPRRSFVRDDGGGCSLGCGNDVECRQGIERYTKHDQRASQDALSTQENHLFAYFLARQAFSKGEKSAAPLIVASLNTYAKVSKMPEQFGLQMTEGAGENFVKRCAR